MRAVTIPRFGAADVLTREDVPVPQPGPNQVAIDVTHAAVGLADVLMRRGEFGGTPPIITGLEVAGTIRALGDQVTGLRVGQPVVTLSRPTAGGYAQITLADAAITFPLDDPSPAVDPALAVTVIPNATTALIALILASAYAGWAGSLPAEVAEQRLRQALDLADGTPEAFVGALLPTMFSKTMPRETVDDFRAGMQAFHPRGFRAMARASAEDVRDVLSHINVPTLLVYGDRDVRAPLTVARDLRAAISGSRLVVLPDAGHVCNIEAPDEFNAAVRDFLHDTRS
jgi:pimeloyl-ACP methyl ester carboxylesterase